jgi:type IV secretory pathway VirB9-like protein
MTVDAIDSKTPSVTVKGAQGRVVTLALQDGKAVQALKVGDTVDVTYYESLLITVSRSPK